MKREELNMDKKFRNKLEGVTAEPPLHVWNNIQERLAEQRRRKRVAFVRWVAAAAVVVMAFLAGWYFNEEPVPAVPMVVENNNVSAPDNTLLQSDSQNIRQREASQDAKIDEPRELLPVESEQKEIRKQLIISTVANKENSHVIALENDSYEKKGSTQFAKIDISRLTQKKVSFQSKQPLSLSFKKAPETVLVEELSEADKVLMAENARRHSVPSEKEGSWKMGVAVSPGYASHVTSHSDSYAQEMTYSGSEGNSNISGGFSVQYKTGKKWSIESGVYYAQNGQRSSNSPNADYYMASSPAYDMVNTPAVDAPKSYFNTAVSVDKGQLAMNSTAGVIEFNGTPRGTEVAARVESVNKSSTTLLTSGEFSQVFSFVEVPLYVRYNIIDDKIGVQVLGGLSAGIVTGNNVYMKDNYGSQNVGKTRDISTFNVSGAIGFGVSYELSRRISMSVEPRFNYYLNSINKDPDVEYRPYRIGIYTGLYYEF